MRWVIVVFALFAFMAVGSLAQLDTLPFLFVSKSVSDEYVVAGNSVEFTVTVYNYGQSPAMDVTVTDILVDGTKRTKRVEMLSFGESAVLKYTVTPKELGNYVVGVAEVTYALEKGKPATHRAYSNVIRESNAHFLGEKYDDESFRGVVSVVTRERYDRLHKRAGYANGSNQHFLSFTRHKSGGMTTNAVRDDSDRTPPLLGLVPSDHGAAKDGASDVNLERNRRSIAAWHQTRLNNIILEEIRKACVSRDDHRLMLKQLISTAYHKDPQRKANIDKWKGIMLAVEKEYVGANALFSISPDPYQRVLAKISSMMIWDGEVRHWEYSYCTEEIARRHSRHIEVLTQLQRAGKHFLNV